MGQPGVVMNIDEQYGANTLEVTAGIEAALADLAPGAAAGGRNPARRTFPSGQLRHDGNRQSALVAADRRGAGRGRAVPFHVRSAHGRDLLHGNPDFSAGSGRRGAAFWRHAQYDDPGGPRHRGRRGRRRRGYRRREHHPAAAREQAARGPASGRDRRPRSHLRSPQRRRLCHLRGDPRLPPGRHVAGGCRSAVRAARHHLHPRGPGLARRRPDGDPGAGASVPAAAHEGARAAGPALDPAALRGAAAPGGAGAARHDFRRGRADGLRPCAVSVLRGEVPSGAAGGALHRAYDGDARDLDRRVAADGGTGHRGHWRRCRSSARSRSG